MSSASTEEPGLKPQELVHLAQFAASSDAAGAHAFLRKLARKYRDELPALAAAIVQSLRSAPLRSATEGTSIGEPIDVDTRLPLVRTEHPVVLSVEPILPTGIANNLQQIVDEHKNVTKLLQAGLAPTRTALFVGAPGVGKTLAARWIARELDLPLLVLDLSSVMSSFLGKTGTNLRRVLDYARSHQSILLLDELDAVAKRRDDQTEIGELKRLVTVLLQEIDSWPDGSLLLAATNHAELLDPAIWRRFDVALDFPLPSAAALAQAATGLFEEGQITAMDATVLGNLYLGSTVSNLQRDVLRARRNGAVHGVAALEAMFALSKERFASMPTSERGRAAAALIGFAGLSQRAVHEITGVSRDTLRKYSKTSKGEGND